MKIRVASRLLSFVTDPSSVPHMIRDMCNDERLVFAWNDVQGAIDPFVRVHHSCCVQMKSEEPDEIPLYVVGEGLDATLLLEPTIIERNAIREYF